MRTLKRRRKEYKTDYLKRLKLLKSEKPRLVFRRTNKYIIAQYVLSEEAKDKVVFGTTSKALLKYGLKKDFKGSLKSIPASYLTGYLIGKEILNRKLSKPILDVGMIRTIHKTKVFAFLKGVIDSGIELPCEKENFPEEEKIKGTYAKEGFSKEFEKIKSEIDKI
jgi:large subunit ribosomal protein L18